MTLPYTTLKNNKQFRNITSNNGKIVTENMLVFIGRREDNNGLHIGFTASGKLGNAVVRNRIKRRIKEAVRLVVGELIESGRKENLDNMDMVIIARYKALRSDFSTIIRDLKYALRKASQ